jgi:hypothetical protein
MRYQVVLECRRYASSPIKPDTSYEVLRLKQIADGLTLEAATTKAHRLSLNELTHNPADHEYSIFCVKPD